MSRKTFSVEAFKTKVNDYNLHTCDSLREGREAISQILEQVLMETGNYKGYKYLTNEMMINSKQGCTVGIRKNHTDGSPNFDFTDPTRVRYY